MGKTFIKSFLKGMTTVFTNTFRFQTVQLRRSHIRTNQVILALSYSLFLFSLGLSLSACDSPCALNSQCTLDEKCVEGRCLKSCMNFYTCAEGEACVEGVCRIPPRGYCQSQQMRRGDRGMSLACEPPDFDLNDQDPTATDSDIDEGNMVTSRDQGDDDLGSDDMGMAGEEMTDLNSSGDEANDMDMAGSDDLGMAGSDDMEMAGSDDMGMAGSDDMSMGGEMTIADMGRPMSPSPWLYTSGPNIYQTGAVQWVGRGVNLHDTRSCDACTWIQPDTSEILRRIDEVVDLWGANFIRLNLESYPIASGRVQHRPLLEDRAYLSDLERIVHHIGQKRGIYVVLNLWREPSLSDEGYPSEQTHELLSTLVQKFYDAPQVIFSVSPGVRQNADGQQTLAAWEAMNNAVQAIRDQEQVLSGYRHLIAVPGLRNQGSDLSYYIDHPITAGGGNNIVYETQIFEAQAQFDQRLVNPAQNLPVIIGAFGPSEIAPRIMTQADALTLIQEAERLNVSWAAWTFHMRCQSSEMLVDRSNNGCGINMPLQPTEWGLAIQGQLGLH